MAAKSSVNRQYIVTTREQFKVFAESDKTSVTPPNDHVNVNTSSSPTLSRVVIALIVAVVITIVASIIVAVVILNRKGDKGETTTVSPANEPQTTDSLSSRLTDKTSAPLQTTEITSTVSPANEPQTTDSLSSRQTDKTSAPLQTTEITSTEPGEVLWSGWEEWTQCTTTCNSGIHRRYRRCIVGDSSKCLGDFVETEICQESTCPVNGKWTTWGSWGSCDITCGKGRQFRVRTCTKSESTDLECVGRNEQEKTCSDWKCPDCSTICSDGTLNSDCDTCVCNGTVITGRVLAETTGNPVSNVALYASTAPTKLLTLSNATGYFALEATCIDTTLFVSREGFVDTEVEASNNYFEISMPQLVLPYLTETPQSKYRLSGENVSMCCEAVASPSIDYFEWFKDEMLLDQTLFRNGTTLTVSNLTTTSSGRYQCRANSAAGAIMSPHAILTVKESSDDFCTDALQQKIVTLPDDCVQISTNTSTYPVGKCISKKCRKDVLSDSGICREKTSTCCMTGEAALEKVQCSGYELQLVVVKSCTCGATCGASSLRISGTARGLEDNSPLKFGEIWANDVFKGYTSITGDFNFEASTTSSTITINLVDNYLKQFLQAVKVININEDLNGVLHIYIKMIKATEPVEVDSTIENTLVAGPSVGNDSTPVVQISIPANSFYYRDGTQYIGTVQASLTFLDATNASILQNIPGVFQYVDEEGQAGNLASLAVFNLNFEDTSGQSLVLDEVVDLFVPEELGNNVTNQDIKLWKMNSKTGIWEYVTPGTGTRRRKRQFTDGWIGEIDWSAVSNQDWWNYDRVYSLTNNPCYFKIRLFTDKLLTEPVPNPEKAIYVDYHIFDNGILTSITDNLFFPEDECVIGICEDKNAYVSLYYYGFYDYEILYAGEPYIGTVNHNYTITDDDKVLKIQMTASADGPFYENKTQCLVSNSDNFHLRYHYGKEFESIIPILTFSPSPSLSIEENINMSRRAWYPFRQEGIRACFIKVRLLFERGMDLSPGQYIKLKATSYGGTNENIRDIILGIKEYIIGNVTENSTYCIEYKCSGTIDPVFDEQTEHTRVVLALTFPSSEIRCEVSGEADFVSGDPTSLNFAQEGSDLGTYEFYAPLVYSPELGIYSATNSGGDGESARDIAKRECQSGEPQNLEDVFPDIGVAVTFRFINICNGC